MTVPCSCEVRYRCISSCTRWVCRLLAAALAPGGLKAEKLVAIDDALAIETFEVGGHAVEQRQFLSGNLAAKGVELGLDLAMHGQWLTCGHLIARLDLQIAQAAQVEAHRNDHGGRVCGPLVHRGRGCGGAPSMFHNDVAGSDQQMTERRHLLPASVVQRQHLAAGVEHGMAAHRLRHAEGRGEGQLAKEPVLARAGQMQLELAQRSGGERDGGHVGLQGLARLQMHVQRAQVVALAAAHRADDIVDQDEQGRARGADGSPAAVEALFGDVVFELTHQPQGSLALELAVLFDGAAEIADVARPELWHADPGDWHE